MSEKDTIFDKIINKEIPADIVFENETITFGENGKHNQTFTYVTLKLNLEAPKSFTVDDWIEIKTPQK